MIGFKVSSSNFSFFKNGVKFIISEINFAEIRGFITLSAVESLQFMSMLIRGPSFLPFEDSSLKSLFKMPAVTQTSHVKGGQEDAISYANQVPCNSYGGWIFQDSLRQS